MTKLVSLPILAVLGFVVATTLVGVSVAGAMTTTSTSTTTTSTTTTTTTTTTTPTGNEGCTPGFWKNHPEDYPTGFSPSTTLGSRFSGLSSTYASMTWDEALRLRGGGLDALLRHAAAALLNAASADVDYPYTRAEVIAMTNQAIASGSYEATKDLFDTASNAGAAGFCD